MTRRAGWRACVWRMAAIWIATSGPLACSSGSTAVAGASDAAKGDARVGVDATSHVCVPGKQSSCPCPGSSTTGVQVCAEDGNSFGSCTGCAVHDATTGDDARTGSDATSTNEAGSTKDASLTKDTGATKSDARADGGEGVGDGGHDSGRDTGATEVCSPACPLGEVCGAGGPGKCGSIYCTSILDAGPGPTLIGRCVQSGGIVHLCQNPSDPGNPDPNNDEPCAQIPEPVDGGGELVCCSVSADAGRDAGYDAGLLTACPDAGSLGACGELANDAGYCGSCTSGASLSCGAAGPNRCGSFYCQTVVEVPGQCASGQAHLCEGAPGGNAYLTVEMGQGCTLIPVDPPMGTDAYVCCPD